MKLTRDVTKAVAARLCHKRLESTQTYLRIATRERQDALLAYLMKMPPKTYSKATTEAHMAAVRTLLVWSLGLREQEWNDLKLLTGHNGATQGGKPSSPPRGDTTLPIKRSKTVGVKQRKRVR